MHPVGPLPPRVYWLRRVIILVLAVVVLLGLVYLISRRASSDTTSGATSSSSSTSVRPSMTGVLASTSRSSSVSSSTAPTSSEPTSEAAPMTTPEAPSVESSVEPSPAAAPSETPSSEPAPVEPPPPATTEEPAPPPERQKDAEGRDLCFDNEITLTAIATGPFTFGQQPVIGVRVQNTGAVACTRDVSASLQVFTVLGADGSHVWSTSDCFPGQGTEVRTLAPGETLEYQVKWSGTTSQPGCTGDRVQVPVGSYQLFAAIGGVQSGPTPFEITG